jgi:alkanesulfonate monooxygenase SsuD/methylene tetrahydromethanopterin reductase-like flavin-dependent oxidoreductase (luciferase family)
MSTQLKFGLLLPHFGAHASMEKCLEGARRAEAYGFDSVWVRDHLVFKPHPSDGSDNSHIESFLALAAVAAVTQRITLGTAMTICHRHPIHLAQSFASLSAISNGRVIMGLGLGGFPHEFAAAARPSALPERAKLAAINLDICRRLWRGEKLIHESDYFAFAGVALKPTPEKPIPVYIGGSTQAACRRAVALGDGWMPARINLPTFIKRVDYLRTLCGRAQKPMIRTVVMPFTTIGKNRDEALRGIDVKNLLDDAYNFSMWVRPPSGKFETLADIQGVILAGAPTDIVRESRAFQQSGADHIVYDLRLRFADWLDQIDWLGKEVLPELRA